MPNKNQPVGRTRQYILEKLAQGVWLGRGAGQSTDAQMLSDWREAERQFNATLIYEQERR